MRYRVRVVARGQAVRAVGLRLKRLLACFHHDGGVCRGKTFGSCHVEAHRLSRHCSERDLARHIGIGDVNRTRSRFVAERGSFVRIRACHNGVRAVLSGKLLTCGVLEDKLRIRRNRSQRNRICRSKGKVFHPCGIVVLIAAGILRVVDGNNIARGNQRAERRPVNNAGTA